MGVAQFIRVGVDINEAGRDDHSAGVNLPRRDAGNAANVRDMAVGDRHVGEEGGIARAVHDASVADDEIVVGGIRQRREQTKQPGQQDVFHRGWYISPAGVLPKPISPMNMCRRFRNHCVGRDLVDTLVAFWKNPRA